MMHATQIIKKPLVTEKSTMESEDFNRYSFEVDMKATKKQITYAVQKLYGVHVAEVRTQVRKGHATRTRHGMSKTRTWKKAVVRLQGDDRIELF